MSLLRKYFETGENDKATIAYLALLDRLFETNPDVAHSILSELSAQRNSLKLIASENYCSLDVQLAMANLYTDKYCEGYPHHRFYAGCENADTIEEMAATELKKLFGADHAYVQPHSGADANLVAYWAILAEKIQSKEIEKFACKNIHELSPEQFEELRQLLINQKMLGMDLDAGGHLTHGHRMNFSSKMFQTYSYGVDPETERVDYADIRKRAKEIKPLILLAGYSAYPRKINFAKMKEIADEVGAVLMVDMAHFAGLVAGKAFTNEDDPIPFADIVTSTTHKTLRGPRGGLILCKKPFVDVVNKGCPLVLGGPIENIITAKLIAFREAQQPSYQSYAGQIVLNAKTLADRLMAKGIRLTTGGTDNHLLVLDVKSSFGLSGKQAEEVFRQAGITTNRNTIPNDPNGAWYCSGVRIGTPALTTRGLKEGDMEKIADLMYDLLKGSTPKNDASGKKSLAKVETDAKVLKEVKADVEGMLSEHPLYPEIQIENGVCVHD